MPVFDRNRIFSAFKINSKNITLEKLISEWPRDNLPLVDFERKIGLVWSARSACSLSMFWYYAVTDQIQEAIDFNHWPHEYRSRVLNISIYKSIKSYNLNTRDIKWIRVMRDPFKRAVSCYRHFVNYLIDEEKVDKFFGIRVRDIGISFEEFLHYLNSIDIKTCDIHFRQQWCAKEYFCPKIKIINADDCDLKNILFGHVNSNKKNITIFEQRQKILLKNHVAKTEKTENFSSKTKIKKLNVQDFWPDEASFDNATTRSMVRQIYAEDYEYFKKYI